MSHHPMIVFLHKYFSYHHINLLRFIHTAIPTGYHPAMHTDKIKIDSRRKWEEKNHGR